MPVTKITTSTAMRARDVSRPREDQLSEAAERERTAGRTGGPAPAGPRPPGGPVPAAIRPDRPKPAALLPDKAGVDKASADKAGPGKPMVVPAPPPARRRRRRGR